MANDLTTMWRNLSLTEDECVEWDGSTREWIEVTSRGKTCVVGKLIVDHFVSKETIKTTL
jgi:preprotein translocase subunit Sec63